MNIKTLNRKLFSFLNDSPTPFHAVESMRKLLDKSGFIYLSEEESWSPITGQPYYIIRENGALIAFNNGSEMPQQKGYRIIGSHSDSPCLQIKPHPDIFEKSYHKVAVEIYGGALLSTWFDRELSIAGRVCYRTKKNIIKTNLIDFNRSVAIIPSLAIHLNREANKGNPINSQKDLNLLLGNKGETNNFSFLEHIVKQLKSEHHEKHFAELLSYDLFCNSHQKAQYSGMNNEFIVSGRLDNLLSCFVAVQAISQADRTTNFMFVCNNHEEIGSTSTSGAQGNMALSVFERLMPDINDRHTALAKSFFISIDNAHAIHPNFQEKSEPSHDIYLNHGPVLKINANQRYASNSISNGIFKILCKDAGIPIQEFVMRNDMACGSTIGPMTAAKLGIKTVDIGAASLAMHSIRELTGNKDPQLMFKVIQNFFNRKELPVVNQ